MQEIEDYMDFRRFSADLKSRVRDYFQDRYQGRVFNEDKILNTLSDPLRELVMLHNCADTVRSVPFFARADSKFIDQLVTRLKFSFFQPDDLVTKIGTFGGSMVRWDAQNLVSQPSPSPQAKASMRKFS